METLHQYENPQQAAERAADSFLRQINPHGPQNTPQQMRHDRAGFDHSLIEFLGTPGNVGTDADIAALTHMKMDVLARRNEADRACLVHMVVPHRVSGPDTRAACDRILDSIQQMRSPEAKANALVRYMYTVPLDGFPSASGPPRSFGQRVFDAAFRAVFDVAPQRTLHVEGDPPPGWNPPKGGSAAQHLQQLVRQRPDLGRALDMVARLPAYDSKDRITPDIIASVLSARFPHHISMPFPQAAYLQACRNHMSAAAATADAPWQRAP